ILYDHPCSRKYFLHPQWPLELEGSPLAYAIAAGSKVGVETLLEIGADPTAPIYGSSKADLFCSDWTPIHLAIKYHSSDILQLLLAAARERQRGVTELWGNLACSAAYSTTLERYAMHGQNYRQRLFDTMNAL
ncbi:hypothetical protein BDZ45DRAFT_541030, partial [Acephala macrosclerotiorum]